MFFLLIPVCAFAKEAVKKTREPIVVTSKMLIIDSVNNTAVFENSVVAETPEMTLYAEKMIVFYNKNTGQVTKVDALGGVTLVEKDSVVTADEATYYALDERVIFKGDLKVVDRENFVSGEEKKYLSDRDRASVDGSTSDLKK
jgi:lipopolysaccharide export system protein LptA